MNKSKLIITFYASSIALCVMTLSMSVAWYASSDRARVNSIEVSVDCDRDLAISTQRDGEYVNSLSYEDLNPSGLFIPLTAAYRSAWMAERRDTPVFYDETKFSTYEFADLKTEAGRGYYSQKLYIKSDDNVYVTIKGLDSYMKANKEANARQAELLHRDYQQDGTDYEKSLTVEQIAERLDKLENAMRFSILVNDEEAYNYYVVDPHKEGDTYLGGLLDNDIDHYYDYYINESSHISYERVYGEIEGNKNNIVYDDALEEDSGYKDVSEEPSAFNARHKKGIKRFNLEKTLANNVEIKKEDSYDLKDFNDDPIKPFHFPVYRDHPQEIVLSIYLEGWDLDSVNYTMGASFISNLSFMIEREM